MIRPPPRFKITDTRFPYLSLFRTINDIGNSGRSRPDGTTAPPIIYEQLIDGYRKLVASAHRRSIKAIGMTILPFEGANYHTDAGEAMRMRVNDWIRTSGTFDAVIDMATVVADPANPTRLDPALQRGASSEERRVGKERVMT